ncbi:MAG: phenylacetyl-CoA dioxygenase [Paucimonas sp.]|nr:phenylacetyl-CoA dioxygenase [Paucimonas sp.]
MTGTMKTMERPAAAAPTQSTPAATAAGPLAQGDFQADLLAFTDYWQALATALEKLPPRPQREPAEQEQAQRILDGGRDSRERFLMRHAGAVYDQLTSNKTVFLRLDELVEAAARQFPRLVPPAELVARENTQRQGDKDGHEIDQGILLSHVLADPVCGTHLCHAMLLPHPRTAEYLEAFLRDGRVDLGTVLVERQGTAGMVLLKNERFLNAEDDGTVEMQEIAVDLCMLDPKIQAGVLRGAEFTSGKHKGKRAYCAGINLTHLYHGKVSYIWYLKREMGFMNKIFRGMATPDRSPDEVRGKTLEKTWISAIEGFAIGGGCQYVLVTDVNLAEKTAYLTLPAKKEGIVPGAANMRLPRFVGDRIARQAVMMERRIDCDSDVGRMICDRIVEDGKMGEAIDEVIEGMNRSGVVSAGSNRRAFRVAHEPLDLFRNYMAMYAREQAYCHFSPALIANLERFWGADKRQP